MPKSKWTIPLMLAVASLISPRAAHAAPPDVAAASQSDPDAAATDRARAAFLRGVEFSRAAQWGDALAAFEEAARERDLPIVQFNIGYCLRAVGRYVAAREVLSKALPQLKSPEVDDARGYLAEIEAQVVRVDVSIVPGSASLSVDGRALALGADEGRPARLAGVAPAGDGAPVGAERIRLVLDPGPLHVFRASRPGHQDAIVHRSYRAGARETLALKLDELPAHVALRSVPTQALVVVDGREVGVAPVDFERPAGRYKIEVVREGFEPYKAALDLHAGQRADLTAPLAAKKPSVLTRWWFWTSAAAGAATIGVVTYFATRPAPVSPPLQGGNTGWVAQSFRF